MVKYLLKLAGFSWKRMRSSLKQKRDEVLFEYFKNELKDLLKMADNEEIDLWFFDSSGFNLKPNIPYCWNPKGQQACLPSERSGSCTVMGLLNIKAQQIEGCIFDGAANADCVLATLNEFVKTCDRKTIIILDNASIHRANKIKEAQKQWRKKQVHLQFIPAYSPELNYIEIFWKMMKHYWVKFEKYANIDLLKEEILRVLNNYGKDYLINFT